MPRRGVYQKEKRKRGRPPKHKKNIEKKAQEEVRDVVQETLPEVTAKVPAIRKDAPETSYFILCNGKPVKNIKELADVMEELEDAVFNHHVNNDKNDFATWIKDVFKDIALAEKITGAKDKKHMQLVLYKHITHELW